MLIVLSINNLYLFFKKSDRGRFRRISLQIYDTFILIDEILVAANVEQLHTANLQTKDGEKFTNTVSIKFHDEYSRKMDDSIQES